MSDSASNVNSNELSDSELFELTVTPVNDSPTIDLPDSLEFFEDGNLTINFSQYIDDIDEDLLILSVLENDNILIELNKILLLEVNIIDQKVKTYLP